LASPELEAILGAIFEAEFCPPEQKRFREHTRDTLLQAKAEKAGIPWERRKLAVAGRYLEYRRHRLAHELPGVPPKFRSQ